MFHCAPNVPHYAKNKAVGVMKAGHAFTIEPMISEGNKTILKAVISNQGSVEHLGSLGGPLGVLQVCMNSMFFNEMSKI